jgi:hypothetical protein
VIGAACLERFCCAPLAKQEHTRSIAVRPDNTRRCVDVRCTTENPPDKEYGMCELSSCEFLVAVS